MDRPNWQGWLMILGLALLCWAILLLAPGLWPVITVCWPTAQMLHEHEGPRQPVWTMIRKGRDR
jgi:hypothetical protein